MLALVAARASLQLRCAGLSLQWLLAVQPRGTRASVIAAHGLPCGAAQALGTRASVIAAHEKKKNPMDRGAQQAVAHGGAYSFTGLSH